MKNLSLFFAVIALLFLSSCASGPTVDPQVTATVSAHHVDQVTYDKISHGQSLDYNDIAHLVKNRVPSHIIVGYLRSTEKVYHFTDQQLRHLKSLGAKPEVINYLNETEGFYAPLTKAHGLKVPKYVRDNTMLNQDKQPFFYNEPIIDDFYDSAYEESCYSPFSMNQ